MSTSGSLTLGTTFLITLFYCLSRISFLEVFWTEIKVVFYSMEPWGLYHLPTRSYCTAVPESFLKNSSSFTWDQSQGLPQEYWMVYLSVGLGFSTLYFFFKQKFIIYWCDFLSECIITISHQKTPGKGALWYIKPYSEFCGDKY